MSCSGVPPMSDPGAEPTSGIHTRKMSAVGSSETLEVSAVGLCYFVEVPTVGRGRVALSDMA